MLKLKQNLKNIIKLGVFLTLSVFAFLSYTYFSQAQIPDFVNYQGRLRDTVGNPITTPTTIQFSLYNHPTNGSPTDSPSSGGALLWTETYDGSGSCAQITPGADGIFAQHLGDCVSFPAYLDFTEEYYLGVKIGADSEATPRVPLSSHPYAFTAKRLNVRDENIYITSENTGDIILQAADDILLYDTNNQVGINGQILSSTGSGLDWIDASSLSAGSLWDADHDTGIQVEEGVDDDMVRFDTLGNQRMAIDDAGNIIFSSEEPISFANPGAMQGLLFRDDKFALRIGETDSGNQWNDANLGRGTFASGEKNIVSGNYSSAFGGSNNVNDVYSTALGRYNVITSSYSVASGYHNISSGYASSVFGQTNQVTDVRAMAWGFNNIASQDEATSWGRDTRASANYATSWGRDTNASGSYSTAFGYQNTASQDYGLAFGYQNTVSGRYATGWGGQNTVSGQYATAWGSHNTASGAHSTAIGYYSEASAENGTAIGDVIANSNYMTAIGRFNENVAGQDATNWVDTDQLFVVGNGTGWQDANRSNALTILKNGVIMAPSFSLAEINTAGNTALVTKEYVDSHQGTLQQTFDSSIAADGYVFANSGAADWEDDGGAMKIEAKSGGYEVAMNEVGGSGIFFQSANGGTPATMHINDGRVGSDQIGIVYGADYSANYTNRSLVDKGYVDGQLMWEILGADGGGGGMRIQPKGNSVRQIFVQDDGNSYTQFKVRNNNDAGNGAGAIIELKGSGADYTNNMYIGKYGASFWIPELRDNGAVLTDKNLVIGTASGSHEIHFVTGDSYTNLQPVVVADNEGFRYTSDLSATFVDRTLVDKGYVDSAVVSSTDWTQVTDGGNNYLKPLATHNAITFGAGSDKGWVSGDDGMLTMGADVIDMQAFSGLGFSSDQIDMKGQLRLDTQNNGHVARIYTDNLTGNRIFQHPDYSGDYVVANNSGASNGDLLTWNGTQWITTNTSAYSDNIYTANGNLSGDRSIAKNDSFIEFTGQGNYRVRAESIGTDYAEINIQGNSTNWPIAKMAVFNGTIGDRSEMTFDRNAMKVNDYAHLRGLEYGADYSANYTNRSLVDKEYVDSMISPFHTTANITSNENGDYSLDDFIFGSPSLDNDGDDSHDRRVFFDKSKAAFRAGYSAADEWDDGNVGRNSIALGGGYIDGEGGVSNGPIASATDSIALGIRAVASGSGSFAVSGSNASASSASALSGGQASGSNSVALANSIASGSSSVAMSQGLATGNSSVAFGSGSVASGGSSIAFGYINTASGQNSIAFGQNSQASNLGSIAFGNNAVSSGNSSFAVGKNMTARSYAEIAVGLYGTDYAPNNINDYDANDRLFNIGNGTGPANLSDAFTMYKSGLSVFNNVTSYGANYSANYTNRSLVDKEYVDNAVTAATNNIYTNDGTLTGNRVLDSLGGYNSSTLTFTGNSRKTMEAIDASNYGAVFLADSTGLEMYYRSGATFKGFDFDNGDATFTDTNKSKGLEYGADYSANYTNRSLVDKEYVDGNNYWVENSNALTTVRNDASGGGANGDGSVAIGVETHANGWGAFAGGYQALTGSNNSFSFGYNTNASGGSSVAFGRLTESSGWYSMVSGRENEASGDFSVAMNYKTTASGDGSVSMGLDSESSGDYSLAGGVGTRSPNMYMTALGMYNVGTNADTLFELGIGVGSSNRANALEIFRDGTINAPANTISLINNRGNRALVTKEYVDGLSSGSGVWAKTGTDLSPTVAGDDILLNAGETLTLSDLSQGSVIFAGAGGLISQDSANFFWDDTNNNLGLGTVTPGYNLTLVGDGSDPKRGSIELATYADAGAPSGIYFHRAGGTESAPTAISDGLPMGGVVAGGYDGSTTVAYSGGMFMEATENWSNVAHGTKLSFSTTEDGTTNMLNRMVIDDNGNVGIGTTNPVTPLHVFKLGQDIPLLTLGDTIGDMQMFITASNPEGSIVGSPGDLAIDNDTNGLMYIKTSGEATNNGWVRLLASDNSITELYDVDTATNVPTNGQVLSWNGTNWVPTTNSTNNIYTADGTLTANRNISLNNYNLSLDNDKIFIDGGNGNIGIGTATPTTFKVEVAGSVGPSADDTYNLGSSARRWQDLYLGPSTLHIGADGDESQMSYNTANDLLTFQNSTDSATGFQFLDADGGTPIFNVDTTNERIGIGTASPSAKLQVVGQIRASSFGPANGTAGSPSYRFDGDSDTGMFRSTTNELAFSTGGTERIRINNVGNVGIGVNNPTYKLDVEGEIMLDDRGGAPTASQGYAGIYTNSGELYAFDDNGNSTQISPHNREGLWWYNSTNSKTGKTLQVEMELMTKKLNKYLGGGYIIEDGEEIDRGKNVFEQTSEVIDNFGDLRDYTRNNFKIVNESLTDLEKEFDKQETLFDKIQETIDLLVTEVKNLWSKTEENEESIKKVEEENDKLKQELCEKDNSYSWCEDDRKDDKGKIDKEDSKNDKKNNDIKEKDAKGGKNDNIEKKEEEGIVKEAISDENKDIETYADVQSSGDKQVIANKNDSSDGNSNNDSN